MSTLEEIKKMWDENKGHGSISKPYDHKAFAEIIKKRTQKNVNASIRYFWASLTLQILVYALLSHILVKYGSDLETFSIAVAGIFLFVPFTVILMRKFKLMAVTRPKEEGSGSSLFVYVQRQYSLMKSFYRFKQRYEIILVPLAAAIGVFLTFKLYVPGGVLAYLSSAIAIFILTLVSCTLAIVAENKKSFERPLHELQKIIDEFERSE